jgi:hypothetical protein
LKHAGYERLRAWSGAVFMVFFFVGFGLIAQYIPPPPPAGRAADVARFYHDHANAIRTETVEPVRSAFLMTATSESTHSSTRNTQDLWICVSRGLD